MLPALQLASRTLLQAGRFNPVPIAACHLTLRFIGPVEAGMAEGIRAWFRGLPALPSKDCRVAIETYGSFPSREGLILFAGLACGPGIPSFKQQLDEGLLAFGLRADSRAFVPHATLARRAVLDKPLEDLAQSLPRTCPEPVPAFTLFESVLGPGGPTYIALEEIRPA